MTRMIPRPLYGPVNGVDAPMGRAADTSENVIESNPRCVRCVKTGASKPLAVYFIVGGDSMCEAHAASAATTED